MIENYKCNNVLHSIMSNNDSTSTRLKNSTRERLKSIGKMGETWDDVIIRLLNFYEKNKKE